MEVGFTSMEVDDSSMEPSSSVRGSFHQLQLKQMDSDQIWIYFRGICISLLRICLHGLLHQFPYCSAPARCFDPVLGPSHLASCSHQVCTYVGTARRLPLVTLIPGTMEAYLHESKKLPHTNTFTSMELKSLPWKYNVFSTFAYMEVMKLVEAMEIGGP